MAWTKRQLVEQAFDEIGLASYVFDISPEQMNSSLRKMDSMMAVWDSLGIRIGYTLPADAEGSDLDDDSGLQVSANQAVYTNLAILIAPSVGKVVSNETKIAASRSYAALLSLAAMPQPQQLPVMPRGAGNKPILRRFTPEPCDPILAGEDGPIEFT